MNYLDWNNVLAGHFFKPTNAGRPVYLFVTVELIEKLGAPQEVGLEDFIAAVKQGPVGATRSGLCMKAWQAFEYWRTRGFDYPPYIGYLCLFVLAAGLEGDFDPKAYYPRFRQLMGEQPVTGQPPSFDKMLNLWADLERWSNDDKSGELGLFNIRFSDNRIHVGLPIAQTLLSESDISALPLIFARAGWSPNAPPSEMELRAMLLRLGAGRLRHQTLKLLDHNNANSDDDLTDALLDVVLEELAGWDGTANEDPQFEGQAGRAIYGAAVICLEIDRVARRVSSYLRLTSRHEFPDDGLSVSTEDNQIEANCFEQMAGWSSPLVGSRIGKRLSASSFDWASDLELVSSDQSWRLVCRGATVRVFASGAAFGVPHLVESRSVRWDGTTYLAVHEKHREIVEEWGAQSCLGFESIQAEPGLPNGWSLYRIEKVLSDSGIRNLVPALAVSERSRIRFNGGIRIDSGHRYFAFALPEIAVSGSGPGTVVSCNGVDLTFSPTTGNYCIPESIVGDSRLEIIAKSSTGITKRRVIFATRDFPCQKVCSDIQVDRFGLVKVADAADKTVTGTLVRSSRCPPFPGGELSQVLGNMTAVLVGRVPGQVARWPDSSVSRDWDPVWAFVTGRRLRTVFCGSSVPGSDPEDGHAGDRKLVNLWKDLLWHRRKRTIMPKNRGLKTLLRRYQAKAREVRV